MRWEDGAAFFKRRFVPDFGFRFILLQENEYVLYHANLEYEKWASAIEQGGKEHVEEAGRSNKLRCNGFGFWMS